METSHQAYRPNLSKGTNAGFDSVSTVMVGWHVVAEFLIYFLRKESSLDLSKLFCNRPQHTASGDNGRIHLNTVLLL